MFGYGGFDVFIIAGFLALQYFFSTRNSVYWGGVIPVIFVVWRTWIFINNDERVLSYVLVLLLGLAFLIGGWTKGRKSLTERTKKELNRMKSLDMK